MIGNWYWSTNSSNSSGLTPMLSCDSPKHTISCIRAGPLPEGSRSVQVSPPEPRMNSGPPLRESTPSRSYSSHSCKVSSRRKAIIRCTNSG